VRETTPKLPAGTRRPIALPNGEPMYFRLIPAGEFRMGQRGASDREEPVHRVVIPEDEDFWMGETPVTQAQFACWTAEEGVEHWNNFADRPDHPAESMDWYQAVRFCEWLTCLAQLLPGVDLARLPSEAEWEYACRAGTETEYYCGDGEAALPEVAWYDSNSGRQTQPVAKKSENAWGLHDMHGNVWEWCADVWDARAYRKRIDGWAARAWTIDLAGQDVSYWTDEDRQRKSPVRVLRGGSWGDAAWDCRSAVRGWYGPSERAGILGFRVCLARSSPAEDGAGGACKARSIWRANDSLESPSRYAKRAVDAMS
jgi:formylglycine-generating enzyme required for sulfatase activity